MTKNECNNEKVHEAANYLKSLINFSPKIGIICGSGLSGLGEDVKDKIIVKYHDIPHYATSTVQGHKGQLVFGKISGKHVMVMQGRFHPYEGYEAWKIALPIRVMKLLGVEIIIITNAAGGLNRSYNVGDFMILKDHISFPCLTGNNPLRGPNADEFGPRFPAVTPAYDKDLQKLLRETSDKLGFKDSTRFGVYCNVGGPTYETIAELNMLSKLGADSVGMSTAQEVIVAAHAGMKVVVCSLITNKCNLDYDSTEVANHKEVLETGKKRADDMKKLFTEFILVLPPIIVPNNK